MRPIHLTFFFQPVGSVLFVCRLFSVNFDVNPSPREVFGAQIGFFPFESLIMTSHWETPPPLVAVARASGFFPQLLFFNDSLELCLSLPSISSSFPPLPSARLSRRE